MKYLFLFASLIFCLSANAQFQQTKIDNHTSKITTTIGNDVREFIVHKPKKAKNSEEPVPVVFMFHGSSGTGKKFFNMSGWKEVGTAEGFMSVFPTGLQTCIEKDGAQKTSTRWLTSAKMDMLCPGQDAQDDLAFVDAMLTYLKLNLNADPDRIYAAGFSNGAGFIMDQLLPLRSNEFAAFGFSGSLLQQEVQMVENPVPVYGSVGELDPLFMAHNNNDPLPILPTMIQSNGFLWDKILILAGMLELDPQSFKTRKKLKSTAYRFSTVVGTDHGQEYVIAVMKGVQHNWPNGKPKYNGLNLAKIYWDFFKTHKKI